MSFKSKLLLSFAGIYLIWGTTYLAVKFSLHGFPPMLMGGIRFTTAGLLFLLFSMYRGDGLPNIKDWKNGIITGFIMNLCGQGFNFFVAKDVPSSIVSLLAATSPLLVVFLDRLFFARKKLPLMSYIGMSVGFIGVASLFSPDTNLSFNYIQLIPILISCICWAIGSLVPKKLELSNSAIKNLGTQLFSGGIMFMILSFLLGEYNNFNIYDVGAKPLFALIYLITFGSIVVFGCYNWLIQNYDSSKVATHGFINPVIALGVGSVLGNEPITLKVIISASIIVLGVMIIIFGKTKINLKFKRDTKKLAYE